jgi:hypothetical protein
MEYADVDDETFVVGSKLSDIPKGYRIFTFKADEKVSC